MRVRVGIRVRIRDRKTNGSSLFQSIEIESNMKTLFETVCFNNT